MDIPIFPTDQAPKPKHEIKIEELEIHPYPDRYRVWVRIKVTAFLERPNLILAIHDTDDNMVSELNIIETMHQNMEFTMHLRRQDDPAGIYTLTVELFYEDRDPPQDEQVESFEIPPAEDTE